MKHNLDWYRHDADAHDHEKFKALRVRFGWEGDGRFWALNSFIARSEGCWLDLGKPYIRATVAHDLGLSFEQLTEFIAFLADAEECKLLIRDGERVTTERVQEAFQAAEQEREINRLRKEARQSARVASANGSTAGKLPIPPGNGESTAGPDHRAEKRREEKRRAEADKAESFPPGKEAAAAGLLKESIAEELEAQLFAFSDEALCDVATKAQSQGVGADIVAFAIAETKRKSPKDHQALLLTALLTWDDMYERYRLRTQQAATVANSKVPAACPECGEPKGRDFRGINGEWWGCQKCGAMAHWRAGEWRREQLADTS